MMLQVLTPVEMKSPVCIELPLSKSISNRMLIMRHLAKSKLTVPLSESNDTRILEHLLLDIENHPQKRHYDARDAGTVFRFLAAVLAITPGEHMLTGTGRMLQRPIKPLVDGLNELMANIQYQQKAGFPPLLIKGKKLNGGAIELDSSLSSQFGSALMMIGPCLPKGLTIKLKGKIVSEPYLKLTASLMRMQGYTIELNDDIVSVPPGPLLFRQPYSEGDWSSASYWYALVALWPGLEVVFENLNEDSPQGDRCLMQIFEPLGVHTVKKNGNIHIVKNQPAVSHFSSDFTACPDLMPAIAVCCAGLNISASLTGIATLRFKESDRVSALVHNLRQLGYTAESFTDELKIYPSSNRNKPEKLRIDSFDDHRIAMAFALLAIQNKNIIIDSPNVVKKSYPQFWQHLARAGFSLLEVTGV
ncbi:MAG: 3-phosphoshikimate 1-carboxyvinyltransferase [Lentimicrobiaceae bacterium]|nr:3-phosphoshikimate 1-carboxyvinyltransferase [Lentimicrobiaceae bacterium]